MKGQSLRIIVNGKPYLVEVGDLTASPIWVRVNGKPFNVKIESLQESPLEGLEERGAAMPSPTRVSAEAAAGLESSVKEVIAPMPGNIMDIRVRVGDRVSYGQELCHLEAMKMKNSIRSPREGVIAAVKVREGQAVAYGETLFTFE